MNPRTCVAIPARPDVAAILDRWAAANQYLLQREEKTPAGPIRTFQKGDGFFVAQAMLQVLATADKIHLEAWISVAPSARLVSFFTLPTEMAIESGGLRGAFSRKAARLAVNDLFVRLGAAPIP